jgi:hypothetical protein
MVKRMFELRWPRELTSGGLAVSTPRDTAGIGKLGR